MFGRNEKVKILTILLFWLMALPQWAVAEWLCPRTLQTFATADECSLLCPGVDCIESGTYMCSADTDGDGETELYQCQQVYQCPLGDYPCNNGQCSKTVACTQEQTITNCILTVSPLYGNSYSFTVTPGSTTCVEVNEWGCSCTAYVDANCDVSLDSPGEWEGCGDMSVYSQPEYETTFKCPINGQTYDDLSSCQSACVQTAACTSSWQCPVEGGTECEDIGAAENYEDESPDLSYYRDDGQIDSDTGACLGQIYIFAGRPMMCRRSGAQTGFHNCCDADDEVVQELNDQLASIGGTFAVISKLKDAVSLASKAIELYDTASKFATALNTTLDSQLVNEVGLSMELPNTIIDAVSSAVSTGGSAADGALNAIVSGLGLSPTGIVTEIALKFAMDFALKILFSGCSEDDVMTAAYNELGLCHYVGTKCVKKLPVIGCVQNANIYCCFNSKLARIIHEQGRPQLKDFGGWGSADYPNCRGFSPQEFQMLDFSRIDLSEWYGDIETRTQSDIEQNVQQNLENFRQNIR